MLYLTRSPQESIRIGDNITVMVIKVEGDRATLGIQAPREVAVVRERGTKRFSPLYARKNGAEAPLESALNGY